MTQIQSVIASARQTGPAIIQRILLIEDDESFAKVFAMALGNRGFQVDCTESLSEAARLIQSERYDCVFCDFHLGKELGTDFYQRHRTLLPNGRFVLISGEDRRDVSSYAPGAYAFLLKPFAFAQVRNLIPSPLNGKNPS